MMTCITILPYSNEEIEVLVMKCIVDTHAANKPIKRIQLEIEKAPPSSVFRFLTTF